MVLSEGPVPVSINEQTRSKPGEIEESPKETRDEWMISIKDKLEQAHREDHCVISIPDKLEKASRDNDMTRWGKLCIYRVPHKLRKNDNKSYSPETISLGPYHHGEKHLQSMESHKWRAVNKVLHRTHQGIEMYIDAMTELEEEARACYEGPIGLSGHEFTQMLVLDGCFVLEVFRGALSGFMELGYARNDLVFAMRGSMHSIQRDMVMLENQLPLFVLDRLLELQLGTHYKSGLVAQLAVGFFAPLIPTDDLSTKTYQLRYIANKDDELHCLEVYRQSLFQSDAKPLQKRLYFGSGVADKRPQRMIRTATELKDGGIKFSKRKADEFWDIGFTNGCLEIPKLLIHDGTKTLFLNIIAFEKCHIDSSNGITSYIIFMGNLIDSHKDVKHLQKCGIIEHWLETDFEVADLFNLLSQEIVFDTSDSYLYQLSKDVKIYYDHHHKFLKKWNAWTKILKEKYFDSPWAYISFFAAVMLLFLTLSQSYFAAYAYYNL